MRTKILLISVSILLLGYGCAPNYTFTLKVRKSVILQLNVYPESRLQDLYKNFFQDKYGPGHAIPDTAAARRYLVKELQSFETSQAPLTEPLGWENNYLRVNLSVIKSGLVSEDAFFSAFLESAKDAQMPSIDEWRKEWYKISKIILEMKPDIPGFDKDMIKIDSLLNNGEYAMHHSAEFNNAYSPHYRIISKNVFEKRLKQIIKQ